VGTDPQASAQLAQNDAEQWLYPAWEPDVVETRARARGCRSWLVRLLWCVIGLGVVAAVLLALFGCAVPRGRVELEGGVMVEQVDRVIPGTDFVVWRTYTRHQTTVERTADNMATWGGYLMVAGLLGCVAAVVVHRYSAGLGKRSLALTVLLASLAALVVGLTVQLFASPVVLYCAYGVIVLACAGVGYWLYTTRHLSIGD
jgi:hypothetical protein